MSLSIHHLIQDVVTRWNSIYFMFEWLLEQSWAMYAMLHDDQGTKSQYTHLYLRENQWKLLQQMVTVLKPLQMATTALCEAETVTVSLVYPVINGLLKKHLLADTYDLSPVKNFKEKVSQESKCRFNPDSIEIVDSAPLVAAAIDHHYHHLKFLSDIQHSLVHEAVKERVKAIRSQEKNNDSATTPETGPKKKESALSLLLVNNDLGATLLQEQKRYWSTDSSVNQPLILRNPP